jgi:hypothetical protein
MLKFKKYSVRRFASSERFFSTYGKKKSFTIQNSINNLSLASFHTARNRGPRAKKGRQLIGFSPKKANLQILGVVKK